MSNFRLIIEDGVSDRYGLAADEVLALRSGRAASPPTLRLYTYDSHSALVGRFQNVSVELHLDYCRDHGISVNRRPTGGGAILMGAQQLGIALAVPGGKEARYGNARALMENFSGGILTGLEKFGIEGLFSRKNDLEVSGRKIAGLGIHRTSTGGLLFHGSLLVDLDVGLMLKVLNTPFEKISDKHIAAISGRITTLSREATPPSMTQVREAIADGFTQAMGMSVVTGEFTREELQEIDFLADSKYGSDGWVYQQTAVVDGEGAARVKTAAGMIGARVTTAGEQLKAVYLEGDFFCSEKAIAALEGSLRWRPATTVAVERALSQAYARFGDDLGALPMDAVASVVLEAAADATPLAAEASDPYGCFVSPGSGEQQYAG